MAINIVAVDSAPIDVNLVGKPYKFKKPKAALALRIGRIAQAENTDIDAMTNSIRDWIAAASSKRQADAIMKRMDDPEDALDFDHLMELIRAVTEEGSARPTT